MIRRLSCPVATTTPTAILHFTISSPNPPRTCMNAYRHINASKIEGIAKTFITIEDIKENNGAYSLPIDREQRLCRNLPNQFGTLSSVIVCHVPFEQFGSWFQISLKWVWFESHISSQNYLEEQCFCLNQTSQGSIAQIRRFDPIRVDQLITGIDLIQNLLVSFTIRVAFIIQNGCKSKRSPLLRIQISFYFQYLNLY